MMSVPAPRKFFATAIFFLFALVPAQARADTTDEAYVLTLDHFGVPYGTRANAVTMGHGACAELKAGDSPTEAAIDLSGVTGLTPLQSGYVVGAAVTAYCPQFKSKEN